jgi:DNA transformation protein
LANSTEFLEHVRDLLHPLGATVSKPMFGGHGLYLDSTIFAIIFDDTLYFRIDKRTRGDFEAAGTAPFTPRVKSKPFSMPYFEAPPETLEESDLLCDWARRAFEAARRSRTGKAKRRSKGGAATGS